jgi:hypothetical protein
MKKIPLLSLPLILSARCFAAAVAEMSGTVFTANPQTGPAAASQPVILYLAAGMAALYFVLRQLRRAH